ncbi:Nucleotide-binding, alpha-beta plait [Artemisia annua]|uniref:Nucleotide-binding, alpha-beta plait n=1 Tax=Artemisia annua TaxID=35608 RepID=A0A2U1MZH5_ARTAN|nr:Nucleotide-binding, alpha-beta plait [Artemisia annua]
MFGSALKLNNKDLMGRSVRLELARERGAFTPGSRNEKPYKKCQGTVFVRGFDTKGGLDNVKNALEKHFGNCGEITRTSIPKYNDSGNLRGYAYIDFAERNGFNKALELDQSKVGGKLINVEEARPRDDSSGPRPTPNGDRKEMRGPGKRGRPGSDNRSREPRRPFGPSRPRGPSKPSITTQAKGTKTVFADD